LTGILDNLIIPPFSRVLIPASRKVTLHLAQQSKTKSSLSDITPSYYATTFIRFSPSVDQLKKYPPADGLIKEAETCSG
jgi:hypothetical protein